jgi:phage protein D
MAASAFRVYFDSAPADPERLDRIAEIRVDQAIDMIAEAQLVLPIASDEAGEWPDPAEDFLQPLTRVRVEVQVGTGDFVPLIEGRVVAQRFEMSGAPNESRAVIVAQDESALMNREDKARAFEDMPPEDIAAAVFDEYGIAPETEPSGLGEAAFERIVVQRGTDIALLRRLARGANMVVHVEPGAAPGESRGRFRRLPGADEDLPELVLTGAARNLNRLTVELDALSPVTARATQLDPASLSVLTAEAAAIGLETLGDVPATDLAGPRTVFVDHGEAAQAALEAAAQATVDRGAWAFSAEGEVSAEIYPGVLTPYRIVPLAGAGGRLSGRYLVSEVSHALSDTGYTQRFVLRRNARSEAAGAAPAGAF